MSARRLGTFALSLTLFAAANIASIARANTEGTGLTCLQIVAPAKPPGMGRANAIHKARVKTVDGTGVLVSEITFSSPHELERAAGGLDFVVLSGDRSGRKSARSDLALTEQLLRTPQTDLTDLSNSDLARVEQTFRKLPRIAEASSASERFNALHDLALQDLIINPGHALVRSRQAINDIISSIKRGELKTPGDEKEMMKFNIITQQDGSIRSVDSWDGHHRLVALLATGTKKLGELDRASVLILVNGVDTTGKEREHRLPISGINVSMTERVQTTVSSKVGTIVYSGRIANFELGSRTTLGKLKQNMLERTAEPRIGVIAFEDSALSSAQLDKYAEQAREQGLNEIVLVPTTPATKLESLNQLIPEIAKHRRLNLYLGDLHDELQHFSWKDVVPARLGQIFGTYDVRILPNTDSASIGHEEVE